MRKEKLALMIVIMIIQTLQLFIIYVLPYKMILICKRENYIFFFIYLGNYVNVTELKIRARPKNYIAISLLEQKLVFSETEKSRKSNEETFLEVEIL